MSAPFAGWMVRRRAFVRRVFRVGSAAHSAWIALLPLGSLIATILPVRAASADLPNGAAYLRSLGPLAQSSLEPHATTIGALVRVPPGLVPSSVGLAPFVPGFARLRGRADQLLAYAAAHPELPLEVAPPPHLLLNMVGRWTDAATGRANFGVYGDGVLVGVADTGIDFTLADFDDAANPGHTRVAWLLDLAIPPPDASHNPSPYAALEAQYGGTVYAGSDLDALRASGQVLPDGSETDTVGHGTHVSSIAAGNGGLAKQYVGLAPNAKLVIARITRSVDSSISSADLLTGVDFLFNRADAMKSPIAVNLSIGSDFGPHDGTLAWEETLATYVGPTHPGRALVVAAGNSGDITESAVHATVFVPPGGSRSIPIAVSYAATIAGSGQVQVWVTMRSGANLSVGLDAPDGTWIAPVGSSQTGSSGTSSTYLANVDNGSSVSGGQIPSGSRSALVIWQGNFAAGTYSVTLTGNGVADLWVEGQGDAVDENGNGVGFVNPVREGTVNIPATNAGLIAVGCTVNRQVWTSIAGGTVSVGISPLDPRGGYALDSGTYLTPVSGEPCWFSSAGPTVTGVEKPEISAPGGLVIAAMSQWAGPDTAYSIFENANCPPVSDGGPVDPRCMQVDATHAVAAGTSMSAPQAAAVAALLFEREPTLTQDKILGLLQAGAHPFRSGPARFEDQAGPGEIDVQGSLDALDQMQNPALALPSKAASWVTLSADELTADGSTPMTIIVELRTVDGTHRADFFDGSRLAAVVQVDGLTLSHLPSLTRRAPGVWVFSVTPPPGLGGHSLTVGATFDGAPIVTPKTVAIATDVWTANYPAKAGGSCAISAVGKRSPWALIAILVLVLLAVRVRRAGLRERRHVDAGRRAEVDAPGIHEPRRRFGRQ